jgi:hypothetical protein
MNLRVMNNIPTSVAVAVAVAVAADRTSEPDLRMFLKKWHMSIQHVCFRGKYLVHLFLKDHNSGR